MEQRPVAPAVDRAALTERFAGTLGDDGVGLLAALDEFRERVLPACMGTPHPLYAASPSRPTATCRSRARFEPPHGDPAAGDRLQEELARRVVATGRAWFSTVRHAGRTWLRFNLVNLHTREDHIRLLADLLDGTARGLSPR